MLPCLQIIFSEEGSENSEKNIKVEGRNGCNKNKSQDKREKTYFVYSNGQTRIVGGITEKLLGTWNCVPVERDSPKCSQSLVSGGS